MKKQPLAVLCAVLLGVTWAGSIIAAEQPPAEMIVAMASSKTVCGGNTGKACPGTAPATVPPVTPPVNAAPKPSPAPTPAPTPTPAPSPIITPAPITTPPAQACTQVITYAKNLTTGEIKAFATPCDVLPGWQVVPASTPMPAPSATPPPASHPMVTATLLGQTGEDVVGTMSATPNGVKDVHVKLSGVSGTIKGVRITGLDGTWVTPANGQNWIVTIRPQSDPSVVDLYFDFYKVISSYTLTLTFSDGATQAFQAATNNPGSIYLPATSASPTPTPTPTPAPTPITAPTPIPTPTPTPGTSNSLTGFAADPAGYGLGFARAHWAKSINKEIVFFGNSHNVFGDNSVRVFDPVTNSWECLWRNEYTPNGSCKGGSQSGGPQNRDNYASLYVPRFDELWVWGGSGLEGLQGSLRSGRFSISQKQWIATSTTDSGAFSAVVSNFGGFLADNATAWSEQADMGMIFGGGDQGNPSNRYWIIEPNPAGPQPYKMSEVMGGVRPPPRAQAMNLLVAAGSDFYLFGGFAGGDANGNWIFTNDFWKFDGITRAWTQLASPPRVSYQNTVTYDSDKRLIVAWVADRIYVYDIASNQWLDQTPAGLLCVGNQIGVYSPTAKVHLFEGGNPCIDGSPFYGPGVYGISLSGSAAPPSNPPPQPTAPPPATVVTNNAQFVSQTVPSVMTAGQQYSVTVTMKNTGTGNWNETTRYRLGSQNPQDNNTWGIGRIMLAGGESVAPSQTKSFTFNVTAPATSGKYNFDWRMVQENVQWFGDFSSTSQVAVTTNSAGLTPPPPPPSAAIPISPPASSGFNLPLRTWIAKSYSDMPGGAACKDGPGCKHESVGISTLTGKWYTFGGDWTVNNGNPLVNPSPNGATGSGRTEAWSMDPKTNTWTLEHPYCARPGEVTLQRGNEYGVAWDSLRRIFWIMPGFHYSDGPCDPQTTGNASTGILTFDPVTHKFSDPGVSDPWVGEHAKNAEYDPVTDSIWRVSQGNSMTWIQFHIATKTWDNFETPCANDPRGLGIPKACPPGTAYVNSDKLLFEHFAFDPVGRKIYVIDPVYYWLLEFDLTTHQLTIKAPIPEPDPIRVQQSRSLSWTLTDLTWMVWDNFNNVALYPFLTGLDGFPKLLIYHPDTDTWETDPMFQPEGLTVRGNSFVFDPVNNYLVSFGGLDPYAEIQPPKPAPNPPTNWFLYRYGNGK